MNQNEADETPTTPRPTSPWCLFQCGSTSYAIGLESVAEVVEVERLVRLPHSPSRVIGLCALRREVIPVVELNEPGDEPSLSLSSNHPPGRLLLLILRTSRGHWGIRIDAEGTNVAEESVHASSPSRGPFGPVFLGTIHRGETRYLVIDPEPTWQNVRQGVDDGYKDRMGRDSTPKNPPGPSLIAALAG